MCTQSALRKKFVTLFASGLKARVDYAAQHQKMRFALLAIPMLMAVLTPIVGSITVFGLCVLATLGAFTSMYLYLQVVLEDMTATTQALDEIYAKHPEFRKELLDTALAQWADADLALA